MLRWTGAAPRPTLHHHVHQKLTFSQLHLLAATVRPTTRLDRAHPGGDRTVGSLGPRRAGRGQLSLRLLADSLRVVGVRYVVLPSGVRQGGGGQERRLDVGEAIERVRPAADLQQSATTQRKTRAAKKNYNKTKYFMKLQTTSAIFPVHYSYMVRLSIRQHSDILP